MLGKFYKIYAIVLQTILYALFIIRKNLLR